ncbi:hypothetical protein MY11210_009300 [Beauveria gryllotalpidicola]
MVLYAALAITGFAAFTTATAAAAAETNSIGGGFFFHIPGHSSSSSSSINSRTLLTSGQKTSYQCLKGLVGCDTECIDDSFECCHVGQGQACEEGYTCYSQGCCRKGQTCSGPPKGCTATTKMCDVGCIPRDRVCCGLGDGSSCDADTVCLDSGLCGRPSSSSNSSSGGGGGGGGSAPSRPSQTATSSADASAIVPGSSGSSSAGTSLRTRTDGAIGASITSSVGEVSSGGGGYSLLPVTPTSGSRGDASLDVSSTSQPKLTTTDKGGAGVTLEAPTFIVGVFSIRRRNCGHSRIVYVHVLSTDFIPEDDRTYGPEVVRRLSKLAEWQREWKTLSISTKDATLRINMDKFEPHSISPEYVYDCYPFFDIVDFPRQHHIKTRLWRCPAPSPDAEVYLKLARFKFEIEALEREVKAYHMLRGYDIAPALVGYVFEETHDRVVGFVTEQVIGHYPRDVTDYTACSAALHKLHAKGLVHGDVNKHNVIITKDGPRFIDFEESRLRNETTDWKQLAQDEEHNLAASLSDQSGQGAPWQQ